MAQVVLLLSRMKTFLIVMLGLDSWSGQGRSIC